MTNEPLQMGDLVEMLPVERPVGQPAPPCRYGQVLAVVAGADHAVVQVEQRHYPLHLLLRQRRRVDR